HYLMLPHTKSTTPRAARAYFQVLIPRSDATAIVNARTIATPAAPMRRTLLAQQKGKNSAPGGNRHAFLARDPIGHRGCGQLATEIRLPQQLSVSRVNGVEVPFAAAGEQESRRCRENPAVGHIGHVVGPLAIAGFRIDRDHGAVTDRFRPVVDRAAPKR